MRRGISLFDFLTLQRFELAALPSWMSEAFERVALEVGTTHETPEFRRWGGSLPAERFLQDVLGIRAIGVDALTWSMVESRPDNPDPPQVEGPPPAREWRVSLEGLSLTLPADWGLPLYPAKEVAAQGTDPRYLTRLAEGETALRGDLHFVVLHGEDGQLRYGLAGPDDPLSGRAGHGAVATAALVPRAAVFSPSHDGFGIVVDRVTIDQSRTTTPPEIAGADPDWTGLRLERAAIYLPHSVPILGNLSLEARELLIPTGDTPGGLTGEVSIETGRIAGSGLTVSMMQGDKSLLVSREAGHRFIVFYDRRFDENGVEQIPYLTAQSPRAGDWDLLHNGAPYGGAQQKGTFGPFPASPTLRLRFVANARVQSTVGFKLLDEDPGPGPTRYPLPPQTFGFVGLGEPPGLKMSISVEVPGDVARGNAMHVTGGVSALGTVRFRLNLPPGAAPEQMPKSIRWTLHPVGHLPGDGSTTALDGIAQGESFVWSRWKVGETLSVVATFKQPQRGTEVHRRVIVTPIEGDDLFVGFAETRDSDARPRILHVPAAGRPQILTEPSDFAQGGWARAYLQHVQSDPHFTLEDGLPSEARPPDPRGAFSIEPNEALIVPVQRPPRAEATDDVPATLDTQGQELQTKRVLTVFYDHSHPLVMLNDGPRTWHPTTGPTAWLQESRKPTATYGRIQTAPAPPNNDAVRRKIRDDFDAEDAAKGNKPEDIAIGMLAAWIRQHNPDPEQTKLYVVAHTSPEDTREDNEKLAISRRDVGKALAKAAVAKTLPSLEIHARAEHEKRLDGEPDYGLGVAEGAKAAKGGVAEQRTRPKGMARFGQLGGADTGPGDTMTDLWIGHRGDMSKDIFLIERNITFVLKGRKRTTPPDPPKPEQSETPSIPPHVPVLVPGPEGAMRVRDAAPTHAADTPWRLRARAVWDAPVYRDHDDLVPNLVEVELAFPLSVLPGKDASSDEAFSILGRVERDRFLDEVTMRLGISAVDTEDGLWEVESTDAAGHAAVAAALFGPLIGRVAQNTSPETAPTEDEGSIPAKLLDVTAAVGAAALFGRSIEKGRFVWTGASLQATVPGLRTGFAIDYLAEAMIRAGDRVFTTEPVAMRWSNVGIHGDWRALMDKQDPKLSFSGMSADYGQAGVEVLSSGRWTIEGALGDLLDLRDIQFNWSSIELSATIVPTLPLGGVKLNGFGLRVRWPDDLGPDVDISDLVPDVSITKIAAEWKMDGVISAKGELNLDDRIAGLLDIEIPPAAIKGSAAFSIQPPQDGKSGAPMVHLQGTIRFATPVPLGGSGLALVGVQGLAVANGTRDITPNPDVIAQELDWLKKPVTEKYVQESGQHAIGFGALLGTMPDAGFMLNASGMLTLAFPEIEVALTADVAFAKLPKGIPDDAANEDLKTTADILGILVASRRGVTLAAEGDVSIPFYLKANIPVGAHFPTDGSGFFIRLGSDGYTGDTGGGPRPGQPITATLYPGLLDVSGWAFVMVEENGLMDLGAERAQDLDLHGFSVGVGVGFDIARNYGPFSLRGYAQLIAGMGLDPLAVAADLRLGGEIDFRIAAVHVDGAIKITFTPDYLELEGTVSGKISFLFFDLEGSARIHERLGGADQIPPPPALLKRVSFVDHRDTELAEGSPGGDMISDVPVDAALRLLFGTTPLMEAASAEGFNLKGTAGLVPGWTGSSDLRHAYKIDAIRLVRADGGAAAPGPWPATVIEPPRANAPGSQAASALHVALLSEDPLPWLGNVDPSDTETSRRVDDLAETTCLAGTDAAQATGQGLWGTDMARRDSERWAALSRGERAWAFRGRAMLSADGLQQLIPALAADLGRAEAPSGLEGLGDLRSYLAGTAYDVSDFVHVPALPNGMPEGALVLPALQKAGTTATALPTELRLDQPVHAPVLTLLADPQAVANSQALATETRVQAQGPEVAGPRSKGREPGINYAMSTGTFRARDTGVFNRIETETTDRQTRSMLRITFSEPRNSPMLGVALSMRSRLPRVARLLVTAKNADGRTIFSTSRRSRDRRISDASAPDNEIEIPQDGVKIIELHLISGRMHVNPPHWSRVDGVLARPPRPRVFGLRPDGVWEGWNVVPAGSLGARGGPLVWRATPESPNMAVQRLFIGQAAHSWIALQDLQGIPDRVRVQARAEAARRATRRDYYDSRVPLQGQAPAEHAGLMGDIPTRDTVPAGTRKPLLASGARYRLEVRYSVRRWQRSAPDEEPPSIPEAFSAMPPGVSALDPVTETLEFRTAPAAQAVAAAARAYSTALPRDTRGRHYTADPMAVVFDCNHVPDLLALADRKLQFRLRRTDPVSDGAEVPPEDISLVRANGRRNDWRGLEEQMSDGLEQTPCIAAPPARGESFALTAPLQPDASYALEITATKANEDPVPIGETRFGTSRYADPEAQLADLGLARMPEAAEALEERIVTQAPTLAPLQPLDAVFESSAAAVGLDIAPSDEAKAEALYRFDTTQGRWAIVGLFIASPEPLERREEVFGAGGVLEDAARLTLEDVTVTVAGQTQTLTAAARDARGTRWIFAPATPLVLDSKADLTLTLSQAGGDWVNGRLIPRAARLRYHARLRAVPAIAEREGLIT